MAKRQFSFDDTLEYDKDELIPNNDLHASSKDNDAIEKHEFVFDDSSNTNNGDIPVKNKKKSKLKMKKWQIALLVLLALIIVFVIYVFFGSGSNDGPVYGNRCAKLLSIDDSQFKSIETEIEKNEKVQDIQIEADCRIIKITILYADNTTSEEGTTIATAALHTLDDSLGKTKEEGASWSQLFNKANGRMQYDVEIVLKSTGDTNYPIFGTKHAGVDNITFTGSNVKDQGTTDRVYQRQAEVDAANQKANQENN